MKHKIHKIVKVMATLYFFNFKINKIEQTLKVVNLLQFSTKGSINNLSAKKKALLFIHWILYNFYLFILQQKI